MVFLFCLIFQLCRLSTALAADNYDGYISDVRAEKEQRYYEIFIFATPPPKEKPLKDVIFNEPLSKEFKEKYREKFGQLDSETIVYQPTKFSIFDENRGAVQSVELANDDRRRFSEYMVRRLTEWHVDNYFKTDPTMRPIYEAKEKISHLEVKVTKETKINAEYSFSGNTLDLIVDNPYLEVTRVSLMMNPSAIGPSNIEDEKLFISKVLDARNRINSTATAIDGIATLEFVRMLKSNWSTNVLTSAAYKAGGTSSRESKYLVGLSHSY